jgi:hypothetical protein
MRSALAGERDAEVPCGSCTACCRSSQFVHIAPDETETLARIPRQLLFPAPRRPRGHMVLGYDERGHCPMLLDGKCSIYEHRPRACRTYDCRVFAAAGVDVAVDDKALIAERARRWRFRTAGNDDNLRLAAIRAAATFLQRHVRELPGEVVPGNATELAVRAVEIHRLFVGCDDPGVEAVASALSR